MKLKLFATKQLEGDVKTFIFDTDEPTTWMPGQYIHLILNHDNPDDRGDERWFTISAAPSDGRMAISTRIVSDHPSSFKQSLASLSPGDAIEADRPEGDFTINDQTRNYIFVAGGIGITPFRSIIKEASIKQSMPKIILLYANRTAEVAFKSELDNIQSANPNLQIQYIYSPEKIDKQLLQKTIQSVNKPFVYISGPEPMVKAFEKIVEAIGLDKKDIKTDFFPGYEAF